MEKFRTDIGMRLILDTASYESVGLVMDNIDEAVREALAKAGVERAAFDFTHFNTHPCKGALLERLSGAVDEMEAMPVQGYYDERRARMTELPLVSNGGNRAEVEPVSSQSPGVRRPVVDSPQG